MCRQERVLLNVALVAAVNGMCNQERGRKAIKSIPAMLVIVFGILAAVFFILSILLIIYICKRRRNRKFCKKSTSKISSPGFGYSLQETDINQSNQSVLSKTKLHTDTGTVPFTPLQAIAELPYDPNYTEIFFESPNSGPISLSSRSGSSSSYEGYTEVARKNKLQDENTTLTDVDKTTTESRNLLDPDTGLVPFQEYDV